MMHEVFSDGNMAEVFRIGHVVWKTKGTWWDATEQVLRHLEGAGYPSSPRILEVTDDKVALSYMPGRTIEASMEGFRDPNWLDVFGRKVRLLHDALEGFRLREGTPTVPWPDGPQTGDLLCHNDLSPWNTVIDEDVFRGFIDWDLVSPATREWELAWVIWRFVPLYPTGERNPFTVEEQALRIELLINAYGRNRIDMNVLGDAIAQRMHVGVESVEVLGRQGVPGFDRLLATGMHLSAHDDLAWFDRHRNHLAPW